jgi:alkanesulfonate monooxygenase SsuD/methylene tetrahydromethanopterin reductase-like flavin-dependent oxidoreductase (luciferase family)
MEFAYISLGDNLPDPVSGAEITDADKHLTLIEQAIAVEDAGFAVMLLGEHHFNYFTISAPVVALSAISQRTSRLRLGTGVTLLPTRDPVFVAEEITTLDVLSGGRAEVGVGRGIHQGIYRATGRSAERASEMLDEGIELLQRLLHDRDVSFSGEWRGPLDSVTIRPRPIQAAIPVWSGSTSNLDLCARLGIPCMWVASVYPYEQLAPLADRYRQAWVDAGRSLDTFQLGIGVHCHVGRTSQEARDRFRTHFGHYFERSAGIEKSNLVRAVAPQARDMSLFDTVPFCGSVEEVVDRIGSARDVLGLTRIGLVIDLGGMPRSVVMEQIDLVAEHVIPALS